MHGPSHSGLACNRRCNCKFNRMSYHCMVHRSTPQARCPLASRTGRWSGPRRACAMLVLKCRCMRYGARYVEMMWRDAHFEVIDTPRSPTLRPGFGYGVTGVRPTRAGCGRVGPPPRDRERPLARGAAPRRTSAERPLLLTIVQVFS